MADPFQQAPTFGEYLNWMKENTTLVYKSGIIPPSEVFILIHDSDGIEIAKLPYSFEERLTPTMVWRIDTLLDVDSPFGKTPVQ